MQSAKFIYVVDNGYSQCIPAVPTAVAELQKSMDTLKDNIKESMNLLHEILDIVAESKLKNAFQSCLVNITAANALVQKTTAATGEANLADIVKPHPGVVPTGERSHLRRCHPLLSEIQEKFRKHVPNSTQTKPTSSQDIDEQHLDSSPQDTDTVLFCLSCQYSSVVGIKYMELPFASLGILSTDSGTLPSKRFKFNFPFDPLTLLHLVPGM